MELLICDRQELDAAGWNKLAESGSFFHSLKWIDLSVAALAPSAASHFLCGTEHGGLCAGMPLIFVKKFGFKTLDALPLGTYGGPIFTPGLTAGSKEEFREFLSAYVNRGHFARLAIVDSFHNLDGWLPAGFTRKPAFTHLITLDNGNESCPPDKRVQRHIRGGQKSSGRIVPIESSDKVSSFYALYALTERRHGRKNPIIERRFFDCLLEQFRDSPYLYWVAAEVDGEMAASQINLIWGDTLFNWQVVSDLKFREAKPNYLLHDDMIACARQRGLKKINLGASPPEADGLIDYKESWGGRRVEYDIITASSPLWRIWERWRR